jgi:mono/diheme cytochrome c family protein
MPARPASHPQIVVSEHPYPHESPVICSTCHNPHSPRIGAPETVVQPLEPVSESAVPAEPEPKGAAGIPLSAASCVGCHGERGEGVGAFPALAGMDIQDFVLKMNRFKSGETPSPMMEGVAKALSDDEIRELANFYAGLTAAEQ